MTCVKKRNNLEINSYYFYRKNKDSYREEVHVATLLNIRRAKVIER
ncbi:hypothetical protein bcgnr5390_52820 [Bacillus luti]